MFSDAIKLADINDYITPESQCILETQSTNKSAQKKDESGQFEVKLRPSKRAKQNQSEKEATKVSIDLKEDDLVKSGGHFDQIQLDKINKSARITLNDCLACSGCITSAETVLIQKQSIKEMEQYLNEHENIAMTLVFTISPQVRVSLAANYECHPVLFFETLCEFLKGQYERKNRRVCVFDSNVAFEITLKESVKEFTDRYEQHYATTKDSTETPSGCFPILSSECPGFVCYAEKTCESHLLDYISAVKSPQQVMGRLIHDYWKRTDQTEEKETENKDVHSIVYHVTIMPCFDKKLEASRKDFLNEVDCVITAVELEQLLQAQSFAVPHGSSSPITGKPVVETTSIDNLFQYLITNPKSSSCAIDQQLFLHSLLEVDNKGSNGYLENIFLATCKKIFKRDTVSVSDIQFQVLRNEDMEEVQLVLPRTEVCRLNLDPNKFAARADNKDELIVLNMLRAYGFRNIQNVVQKIKKYHKQTHQQQKLKLKQRSDIPCYHYVEIMACPQGCLNGGGLLKAQQKKKEWIQLLRNLYKENQRCYREGYHLGNGERRPSRSVADVLYANVIGDDVGSDTARTLFHTQYHHVSGNVLDNNNSQQDSERQPVKLDW
ncbi:nuclear prelamin A recognition factor-like protein [Reticulomyxa filosa]|uniref:Nuclear prelamin A recognition factor-like protein n=1 Tax=Reticulomyxa filosa TaxID=46433 RepID=X6LC74_RETFI|nr:nuclear prelamin A recognition factor-like protein [Reticulomyxa filosa]|eukprot:ETN99627.1 nuclear prelamin A recognition factor-like protein [Reticulomyxa filosa]